MAKSAASPLRQCVALGVAKAKLRAGQLVARARWRRCFAFSLALRLFARIVLLDLAVLFTWSSDLDALRHSTQPYRDLQNRAWVGGADMDFEEAGVAAQDFRAFDQVAHVLEAMRRDRPLAPEPQLATRG